MYVTLEALLRNRVSNLKLVGGGKVERGEGEGGRRKEEGRRRKEEGGRRKEEGDNPNVPHSRICRVLGSY